MVVATPAVITIWGGIGYESGASTIMAGGSDMQGEAGHIQLGPGCGYSADGLQGWKATRVMYVTYGVTPTQEE